MAKSTSNPFKKAAEKQKKAPGGEIRPLNEAVVETPVVHAPVVETQPQAVVEEKVIEAAPVVAPAAPAVEPTPAPVVEPVQQPKVSQPVDMMSFYKDQVKPKKDEKVRKQFVIPKSIDDKLKKAMKNKEIPSENQLINDLLKNFFDGKLLYREVE